MSFSPQQLVCLAVIFVSGGTVMALELLASRIMTPYFGVSLYIWTGILSITLLALAVGYWAGGVLARNMDARLETIGALKWFFVMPAFSAASLVIACLIYPHLFAPIALADPVFGSFLACLILLFVPCAASASMNPLLVAHILVQQGKAGVVGDGGAGRVFFVSTVGSVGGVIATGFLLIPNLSNQSAVLLIAAILAVLALAAPLGGLDGRPLRPVLIGAALALAAALIALFVPQVRSYRAEVEDDGQVWRVVGEYPSLFGTVKIVRTFFPATPEDFNTLYLQDGMAQNAANADGHSIAGFTQLLEVLSVTYRPDTKRALVLGLGAGIIPMRLADRGIEVEVAEINPQAVAAATTHFGFDRKRVTLAIEDARTKVRHCGKPFDVVIVDLFQGDGIPEHLATRGFFTDIARCLSPGGVLAINSYVDLANLPAYANFYVTVRSVLPHIRLHVNQQTEAPASNGYIVASASPLLNAPNFTLPPMPVLIFEDVKATLESVRELPPALLARAVVIDDDFNPIAFVNANSYLNFRRRVVGTLPPALLVN